MGSRTKELRSIPGEKPMNLLDMRGCVSFREMGYRFGLHKKDDVDSLWHFFLTGKLALL